MLIHQINTYTFYEPERTMANDLLQSSAIVFKKIEQRKFQQFYCFTPENVKLLPTVMSIVSLPPLLL